MKKRRATTDAHIVLFLVFTGILMSYIVKHYLSDYFIARPRLFTAIIFLSTTFILTIYFIDYKNDISMCSPLKALKLYVKRGKGVIHKSGVIVFPVLLCLSNLYILAYNWNDLNTFGHYFYCIWLGVYFCSVVVTTIIFNAISVYEDEYENLIKCNL